MAKPSTHTEYSESDLLKVKSCCLYLATILGSWTDEIVVVGGLVPSLLSTRDGQSEQPDSDSPFAGLSVTKDLDLGLSLSLLNEERYTELSAALREGGFSPDYSNGNPTLQRWRIGEPDYVTVDFLIEPSRVGDRGGRLRHLQEDFAAFLIPGLYLAFADRKSVRLEGRTILGEWAERDMWVCGPGAFLVLKALALKGRGINKDPYDICYLLNSAIFSEASLNPILDFLSTHWEDRYVQEALSIIRREFGRRDGIGPMRAARFLGSEADENVLSDAYGLVQRLLDEVDHLA